jgi:hypothetical protein
VGGFNILRDVDCALDLQTHAKVLRWYTYATQDACTKGTKVYTREIDALADLWRIDGY